MSETGTMRVKSGLAEMLKGGVIMDVVNAEQAKIAEDAGAVAVMALERVPADIRRDGGVSRMSDPAMIEQIQEGAVTLAADGTVLYCNRRLASMLGLPQERVIAALDARHGEVVIEGWQKRTGHGVLERIAELQRDLATVTYKITNYEQLEHTLAHRHSNT